MAAAAGQEVRKHMKSPRKKCLEIKIKIPGKNKVDLPGNACLRIHCRLSTSFTTLRYAPPKRHSRFGRWGREVWRAGSMARWLALALCLSAFRHQSKKTLEPFCQTVRTTRSEP